MNYKQKFFLQTIIKYYLREVKTLSTGFIAFCIASILPYFFPEIQSFVLGLVIFVASLVLAIYLAMRNLFLDLTNEIIKLQKHVDTLSTKKVEYFIETEKIQNKFKPLVNKITEEITWANACLEKLQESKTKTVMLSETPYGKIIQNQVDMFSGYLPHPKYTDLEKREKLSNYINELRSISDKIEIYENNKIIQFAITNQGNTLDTHVEIMFSSEEYKFLDFDSAFDSLEDIIPEKPDDLFEIIDPTNPMMNLSNYIGNYFPKNFHNTNHAEINEDSSLTDGRVKFEAKTFKAGKQYKTLFVIISEKCETVDCIVNSQYLNNEEYTISI